MEENRKITAVFFITGTSRGIGKALAEAALSQGAIVYGYSRNNAIEHPSYIHTSIDLSDIQQVDALNFPDINSSEKIILINNAGSLGEMKHVGRLTTQNIVATYNINTIAPIVLSNKFVKKYQDIKAQKTVLNISSGAAIHLSDGWSIYSSTKSALDTFTKVAALEQKITSGDIRFLSVHPGIIETQMQELIRKNNKNDFSNVEYFRELKKNGELKTPGHIARLLLQVINGDYSPQEEVVFSLRNHPEY